jgi:hypothetical protein
METSIVALLLLVPAAAVLIAACAVTSHVRRAVRVHGVWTVAGRWLTGVHLMNGRYHWTNAGWFTRRENVQVLHRSRWAPAWQHRNLATRTAWRTGGTVAAVAVPVGLLADFTVTVAALAAVAVVVVTWVIARRTSIGRARVAGLRRAAPALTRKATGWLLRMLRHRSRRVQPMAAALATITGTGPKAIQAGVVWNPDYANAEPGDQVATWRLPAGFKATGKERAAVEDLWRARTGLNLNPEWRTYDEQPELRLTRAHELPSIVYLHSVLGKVERLPEDKTAIGVDDQGNLVCWDWGSESPHGLMNAGSRHGKTETEEGMVCQVIRKGGRVTYIDVKRTSIQGLKGLPGLTLCDNPRDMPGIWAAIQAWGDDLDQRIDDRTKDPTKEFCRNLLVLEEVNQFSEMCDEFWETWPEEDEDYRDTILWKPKRAKKTPPIWRVVKKGVWEGAFVKNNVLIAGQNIEAQTVRGIRNSIGMRLLGGYQPQNWKALVGTTPVPAAPPQKGRWCLVNGSTQTWVQAIIADLDANRSAAIWRDYARNGRRLDGTTVTGSVCDGVNALTSPDSADVTVTSGDTVTVPERLVGLTEALGAGIVTGDRRAVHQASYRPGFPEHAGTRGGNDERVWRESDLAAWEAGRRKVVTR